MAKRVVAGIAAVVAASGLVACGSAASGGEAGRSAQPTSRSVSSARVVPRLVDVGAGKCIPCKAMAPILDQLRADYAGRLEVVFVDVWKEPDEARSYGVHMIPTQIFYGPDGRELARHEGFIDREGILARWKSLGVEL